MRALLSPGERLLDRLMMGYTDPDDELLERARCFRAWADKNPLSALRWLPKLRRTHYCTARLWNAVEHIVDPRAAAPAVPQGKPDPEPRTSRPERAPEAPAVSGLPVEYSAWRRSLPAQALAEAEKYAPTKAREAHELEARAGQPVAPETKRAILRRAIAAWCALLNVKEPALW